MAELALLDKAFSNIMTRLVDIFRSEEHARNWREFDPEFSETLQPLDYWVGRFSEERHRARGAPDYISRRAAGSL